MTSVVGKEEGCVEETLCERRVVGWKAFEQGRGLPDLAPPMDPHTGKVSYPSLSPMSSSGDSPLSGGNEEADGGTRRVSAATPREPRRRVTGGSEEGGDKRGERLTIGGCSGNASWEPTTSFQWDGEGADLSSGEEVDDEELAKSMDLEKAHPLWSEKLQKANEEWRRMQAAPVGINFPTLWKDKDSDAIREAWIGRMGPRSRRLLVYYPHGEGRLTNTHLWRQAKIRAEIALAGGKGTYMSFPWPLEKSLKEALRDECRRTRRPMPLKKWERLFRLSHPENQGKLWSEFSCSSCGRKRYAEATMADVLISARIRQGLHCRLVGTTCDYPETARVHSLVSTILNQVPRAGEQGNGGLTQQTEHVENDLVATDNLRDPSPPRERRAPAVINRGREVRMSNGQRTSHSREPSRYSSDVEEVGEGTEEGVGLSAAAQRFYRTTGRSLPLPDFAGSSSESAYLAWKRGVERHFCTHGIVVEREKVTIAGEMLSGEAWN